MRVGRSTCVCCSSLHQHCVNTAAHVKAMSCSNHTDHTVVGIVILDSAWRSARHLQSCAASLRVISCRMPLLLASQVCLLVAFRSIINKASCYMQDTSFFGEQGVFKAVGTSRQSLACAGRWPPHKCKWQTHQP